MSSAWFVGLLLLAGATAAASPLPPPRAFYSAADTPQAKLYGAGGATWLTGHPGDEAEVRRVVEQAGAAKATPVFVLYAIPGRDKSGPSGGGAGGKEAYLAYVDAMGKAIGEAGALVVVEPDALPLGLDAGTVRSAVEHLRKACPHVELYIDAGHPNWKTPVEMAPLLVQGGIELADGFSLNVSAFEWTAANLEYGDQTLQMLGTAGVAGKRFVIDTSRNGNGPGLDEAGKPTWGDPVRSQKGGPIMTGPRPTSETGNPHCTAFLWVKGPGYGDNRTRPADKFGGLDWVLPNPDAPKAP